MKLFTHITWHIRNRINAYNTNIKYIKRDYDVWNALSKYKSESDFTEDKNLSNKMIHLLNKNELVVIDIYYYFLNLGYSIHKIRISIDNITSICNICKLPNILIPNKENTIYYYSLKVSKEMFKSYQKQNNLCNTNLN